MCVSVCVSSTLCVLYRDQASKLHCWHTLCNFLRHSPALANILFCAFAATHRWHASLASCCRCHAPIPALPLGRDTLVIAAPVAAVWSPQNPCQTQSDPGLVCPLSAPLCSVLLCSVLFCCSLARFSAVRKMWAAAKESKKKQNSKSRANRSCNPLPQNADRKQLKQAELPRVAECTPMPLKRERAKWDKDEQSAHCDARGVEKRRGARGRMHCGALIVAISR